MTSAGLGDLIPPALFNGKKVAGEEGAEMEEEEALLTLGLGSLSINEDGSTRFLGLSAGSAYYSQAQDGDSEDSEPSPAKDDPHDVPTPPPIATIYPFTNSGSTYPISQSVSRSAEIEQIRAYLPSRAESERLALNYWNYVTFCFEPVTEFDLFDDYLPAAYRANDPAGSKLACVLCVLSLGALFDRTSPSTHNSVANQYFLLSQNALAASRFLSVHTIPGIQALQLSSSFLFNTHRFQDAGETFFSLLGVAMRGVGTMGLHRDGSKFGVEGPELDRRRLIFYELLALDRHQSFISGRPYLMAAHQFDTEMPSDACDYQVHKWKLAIFLGRIMDDAFSVKPPTYVVLMGLDQDLRDIVKDVPVALRSGVLPETAFVTRPVGAPIMPSTYTSSDPLKDQMRRHTIDLLYAQILLYLHKPAFSQALLHYPEEPLKSPWAPSVKAVVLEAGVYVVAIAGSWINLDPILCPRWWHTFFHAFAASVAQASLVIQSPRSMLSQHAWAQLNIACKTFEIASIDGAPVSMLLPRLLALRDKAYASLQGNLVVPKGVHERTGAAAAADDSESVLGPINRLSRKPMRNRPSAGSSAPLDSPPVPPPFNTTPPVQYASNDYFPPSLPIPRNFQQEYQLPYSDNMRDSTALFGHYQPRPNVAAPHYPIPPPLKNYDHISSILPSSYFSGHSPAVEQHRRLPHVELPSPDHRPPPLRPDPPALHPQHSQYYPQPRIDQQQQHIHEQQRQQSAPPPSHDHQQQHHRQVQATRPRTHPMASVPGSVYGSLPPNYVPGPAWGGALAYPVMPPTVGGTSFESRGADDDEHWGMWAELVDQ